jgi:hypothetical protein
MEDLQHIFQTYCCAVEDVVIAIHVMEFQKSINTQNNNKRENITFPGHFLNILMEKRNIYLLEKSTR